MMAGEACLSACGFCNACTSAWDDDDRDALDDQQREVVRLPAPAEHDDDTVRRTVNRAAMSPLSNYLFDTAQLLMKVHR